MVASTPARSGLIPLIIDIMERAKGFEPSTPTLAGFAPNHVWRLISEAIGSAANSLRRHVAVPMCYLECRSKFYVTCYLYEKTGGPDTIRTYDLCLRRAALYPAELRVRDATELAPSGAERKAIENYCARRSCRQGRCLAPTRRDRRKRRRLRAEGETSGGGVNRPAPQAAKGARRSPRRHATAAVRGVRAPRRR